MAMMMVSTTQTTTVKTIVLTVSSLFDNNAEILRFSSIESIVGS